MLTDLDCRTAEPGLKPYKLYDSGGLYLLVKPNGSKLWQMKYEFTGKAKTYSIGAYGKPPLGVPLAQARLERDKAKSLLKEGRDPTTMKRLAKAETTQDQSTPFEAVCEIWLAKQRKHWSAGHAANVTKRFQVDVYPSIGKLPIKTLTTPIILKEVLSRVEARGALETARRLRMYLSSVFQLAASQGLVPLGFDPAGQHVLKALAPIPPVRPHPAITELDKLREMLRKAEEYPCKPTTKLALRFMAVTTARAGTLSGARWEQFVGLDGPLPVWEAPADIMKGKEGYRRPFTFPLCRQAVDVLMAAQRISGDFPYVFPSDIDPNAGAISNNAITFHMYRIGYRTKQTQHGLRASFSTIMNERHPELRQVIDFALAHAPTDKVEAAYNRAKFLEERRKLHQEYADLLLEGFPPASALLDGPRR